MYARAFLGNAGESANNMTEETTMAKGQVNKGKTNKPKLTVKERKEKKDAKRLKKSKERKTTL